MQNRLHRDSNFLGIDFDDFFLEGDDGPVGSDHVFPGGGAAGGGGTPGHRYLESVLAIQGTQAIPPHFASKQTTGQK